jgi:hypothetical protein
MQAGRACLRLEPPAAKRFYSFSLLSHFEQILIATLVLLVY